MSVIEPSWSMEIERLGNGYVVHLCPYGDDGEPEGLTFQDDDDDPLQSIEDVLWATIEHFGVMGSRYDKERLVIRREPGDKYFDIQPPKKDKSKK